MKLNNLLDLFKKDALDKDSQAKLKGGQSRNHLYKHKGCGGRLPFS